MSSPNLTEPEVHVYRKPRADVYTMLLVIALLALIVGILALYAYMAEYNMDFKGRGGLGMAVPAVAAPANGAAA
jgi:hypothetical protein